MPLLHGMKLIDFRAGFIDYLRQFTVSSGPQQREILLGLDLREGKPAVVGRLKKARVNLTHMRAAGRAEFIYPKQRRRT